MESHPRFSKVNSRLLADDFVSTRLLRRDIGDRCHAISVFSFLRFVTVGNLSRARDMSEIADKFHI